MKTKQAKKAVAACRNRLTDEYRVCVMTRTGTNFYFRLGDTTWFESDMLYVYDARTKTLFVIDCQEIVAVTHEYYTKEEEEASDE